MDVLIYGASLVFIGSELIINNTLAYGNTGLKGGFLLIEKGYSTITNIWILNSLVTKNIARNGPAFYLGENVKNLQMIVANNYIYDNYGWGIILKIKFFYFTFRFSFIYFNMRYDKILFILDGGVGFLKITENESHYISQNNFFYRNKAVVGGTFFYELLFGTVTHDSNVFLENWGFSMVGMGGCFGCSATTSSLILNVRNKFFLHMSDYVGTIACSGGRLEFFHNVFYGLIEYENF